MQNSKWNPHARNQNQREEAGAPGTLNPGGWNIFKDYTHPVNAGMELPRFRSFDDSIPSQKASPNMGFWNTIFVPEEKKNPAQPRGYSEETYFQKLADDLLSGAGVDFDLSKPQVINTISDRLDKTFNTLGRNVLLNPHYTNQDYISKFGNFLGQKPEFRDYKDLINSLVGGFKKDEAKLNELEKEINTISPQLFGDVLRQDLTNLASHPKLPYFNASQQYFPETARFIANAEDKKAMSDLMTTEFEPTFKQLARTPLTNAANATDVYDFFRGFKRLSEQGALPHELRKNPVMGNLTNWMQKHYGTFPNATFEDGPFVPGSKTLELIPEEERSEITNWFPKFQEVSAIKDLENAVSDLFKSMKTKQEQEAKEGEALKSPEKSKEFTETALNLGGSPYIANLVSRMAESLKATPEKLPKALAENPMATSLQDFAKDQAIDAFLASHKGDKKWQDALKQELKKAWLPYLNQNLVFADSIDEFVNQVGKNIEDTGGLEEVLKRAKKENFAPSKIQEEFVSNLIQKKENELKRLQNILNAKQEVQKLKSAFQENPEAFVEKAKKRIPEKQKEIKNNDILDDFKIIDENEQEIFPNELNNFLNHNATPVNETISQELINGSIPEEASKKASELFLQENPLIKEYLVDTNQTAKNASEEFRGNIENYVFHELLNPLTLPYVNASEIKEAVINPAVNEFELEELKKKKLDALKEGISNLSNDFKENKHEYYDSFEVIEQSLKKLAELNAIINDLKNSNGLTEDDLNAINAQEKSLKDLKQKISNYVFEVFSTKTDDYLRFFVESKFPEHSPEASFVEEYPSFDELKEIVDKIGGNKEILESLDRLRIFHEETKGREENTDVARILPDIEAIQKYFEGDDFRQKYLEYINEASNPGILANNLKLNTWREYLDMFERLDQDKRKDLATIETVLSDLKSFKPITKKEKETVADLIERINSIIDINGGKRRAEPVIREILNSKDLIKKGSQFLEDDKEGSFFGMEPKLKRTFLEKLGPTQKANIALYLKKFNANEVNNIANEFGRLGIFQTFAILGKLHGQDKTVKAAMEEFGSKLWTDEQKKILSEITKINPDRLTPNQRLDILNKLIEGGVILAEEALDEEGLKQLAERKTELEKIQQERAELEKQGLVEPIQPVNSTAVVEEAELGKQDMQKTNEEIAQIESGLAKEELKAKELEGKSVEEEKQLKELESEGEKALTSFPKVGIAKFYKDESSIEEGGKKMDTLKKIISPFNAGTDFGGRDNKYTGFSIFYLHPKSRNKENPYTILASTRDNNYLYNLLQNNEAADVSFFKYLMDIEDGNEPPFELYIQLDRDHVLDNISTFYKRSARQIKAYNPERRTGQHIPESANLFERDYIGDYILANPDISLAAQVPSLVEKVQDMYGVLKDIIPNFKEPESYKEMESLIGNDDYKKRFEVTGRAKLDLEKILKDHLESEKKGLEKDKLELDKIQAELASEKIKKERLKKGLDARRNQILNNIESALKSKYMEFGNDKLLVYTPDLASLQSKLPQNFEMEKDFILGDTGTHLVLLKFDPHLLSEIDRDSLKFLLDHKADNIFPGKTHKDMTKAANDLGAENREEFNKRQKEYDEKLAQNIKAGQDIIERYNAEVIKRLEEEAKKKEFNWGVAIVTGALFGLPAGIAAGAAAAN